MQKIIPRSRKSRRLRIAGIIVGIIAGLLLVIFVVLYVSAVHFFETGLLKVQSSRHSTPGPVTMLDVDGGTQIAAVYMPAPTPDAYTILYNYGNLEDVNGKYDLFGEFHQHGYGVFGYDYEGFGSSKGEASLSAALRDAETAYRYLTEHCNVAPERIIAVGFSMGTGPAAYLGYRHPLAGVVLESSLASVFQIMIPWSGWPGDSYPVSRWLTRCSAPVLLLHGTEDKVISYRNAETNYRKAAGRKRLVPVPGAGHSNVLKTMGHENYFRLLAEFFPRPGTEPSPSATQLP